MSSFKKSLITLIDTIEKKKKYLVTEASTKVALISPLVTLLGYDVSNPEIVRFEYIADIGIKKGEKVDYAIVENDVPKILIEAKCFGEDLNNHYSQLYRYFSTTPAKFAILTDGVIYKFYSDIEEVNKMDLEPFAVIDLLNISEDDIKLLDMFRKDNFNEDLLSKEVTKWKYELKVKAALESLFNKPTDDFIRLLIGSKNTDKYKPIVERILSNYKYIEGSQNKEVKDIVTIGSGMLPLSEFDYNELIKDGSKIKPISLCVDGEEFCFKTWKGLVVVAIDYLYKTHKDKLCTLIDEVFKGNKVFLYSNLDELKAKYTISNDTFVHKIDEGVYMYVNYGPIRSVETILVILGLLGLPKDYFSLKYSMTTI